MNNETCIHGGISPVSLLLDLHHNQGGSGRHKCPTCAFEQGFILGSTSNWENYIAYCKTLINAETCPEGSIAPTHILQNLGENQGGTGRHKCTNCAFKEGFLVGILENNLQNITLDLVEAPKTSNKQFKRNFKPTKATDFIKEELKNRRLGHLGELFVLEKERNFLIKSGEEILANKIEHSSLVKGDGLGYDILSYDVDGNEKYIEVKTTRSNISRPFFITINEIEFSKTKSNNYFLYRIFDFDTNLNLGKYYILNGNLIEKVNLQATQYLAYPI